MTYFSSLYLASPFRNQKIFEDNQLDGFEKNTRIQEKKMAQRKTHTLYDHLAAVKAVNGVLKMHFRACPE
jgi:hypothetical protein